MWEVREFDRVQQRGRSGGGDGSDGLSRWKCEVKRSDMSGPARVYL